MLEGIPKISVLIICYKQEELIKRAINSLLAQKDYIYEICVSDDCSPDRTWQVLQEYDKQYPGLFKLHQNHSNLGIFENLEYTWIMPSGDVVYQLSGDDECGKGWFKTVIDYILKNNINYKNELFCIYGDYACIDLNKKLTRYSNNLVLSGANLMSLALRGLICNRSTCFSVKIMHKYFKTSKGRSHIAEDSQDRQLQFFTEKNYYISLIGNIYHSGIGVSIDVIKGEHVTERKHGITYMVSCFSKYGYSPTKYDRRYIKFDEAFNEFLYRKSIRNIIRMAFRLLISYDTSMGFKSLKLVSLFSHLNRVKFNLLYHIRETFSAQQSNSLMTLI
ncbi:MAG: glycosyltransferase family 2 protein [Bacteroidales bacterium]|nr:glycosyltransferase family 2 protein [Bacteroidales bacterium]